MGSVTVNFIASEADDSLWRMVLVEEGPWNEADLDGNLRKLQDRLYGCVDAALDGELARLYPRSTGKSVVIRLDCYNVPEFAVRELFRRFSEGVLAIPDYQAALANNRFVRGVSFEFNCSQIH